MPPSREPWIKLKIGLRRSDKMAALPSDPARLGWVYVLLEAKMQRQLGVFFNRRALVDLLGKYGRFLDDWIAVGLAHEAPRLCERCKVTYRGVRRGEIVVHDFRREQRDPTNAERQEAWREGKTGSNPDQLPLPPEPAESPAGNGQANGDVTANITRTSVTNAADSNGERNGRFTGARNDRDGDSDKRRESQAPSAVPARAARGASSRNGHDRELDPSLTLSEAELAAWADFTREEWAPFKTAWIGRGFKLPPSGDAGDDGAASQRSLLFSIAQEAPASLARWIAEAPRGTPRVVIDHVLERWHAKQADVGVDEDDAERVRRGHEPTALGEVIADMSAAGWFTAEAKP